MALPVNIAKIAAFDQEHQTLQEVIKEMGTNLDLMNKIIRTNILENQQKIKTAFDDKVTPYHYTVGSVVPLNNPVEKVGIFGKLRRHWVRPYTIVWLDSQRCKLINHVTGKQVNNLVHINQIKPHFYRDEIPDDPDTIDNDDLVTTSDTVADLLEPKNVKLPQAITSKKKGRPRGSGKAKKLITPNTEQVVVPTNTVPSPDMSSKELLTEDSNIANAPDFDIMYEEDFETEESERRTEKVFNSVGK